MLCSTHLPIHTVRVEMWLYPAGRGYGNWLLSSHTPRVSGLVSIEVASGARAQKLEWHPPMLWNNRHYQSIYIDTRTERKRGAFGSLRPNRPRISVPARLTDEDHGPLMQIFFFFLTVSARGEKRASIWRAIFFQSLWHSVGADSAAHCTRLPGNRCQNHQSLISMIRSRGFPSLWVMSPQSTP